jgi:xanthine dehydrogenase accessory factor
MKDVLNDINQWRQDNEQPIALATVVQTWGSAPRKVGAKMAMMPGGQISGSVSGGCVEGAVFETGTAVLETGKPQLLHFGVADDTAWEVGLACGGIIEVFVEPLNVPSFDLMKGIIEADRAGDSVTIIRGPADKLGQKLTIGREGQTVGTLGAEWDALAVEAARSSTYPRRVQLTDEVEVFVDTIRPSRTLIMVGGVHIAVALTSMAKMLDYNTIVVDPRRAFGSEARFPHVDTLIQAWPNKAFAQIEITPETAVAMLTHDPKIDDPALKVVLNSPAFYIGALGSSKTQAKRQERLREMGFSDEVIGRIHGPIGLDINASTPEEIALSVMAEIVKAQRS